MIKAALAGLAAMAVFSGANAEAQFAGLFGKSLGLPAKGDVGGAYQSGNQIRTFMTSGPYQNAALYAKLVEKASAMAEAKGYAQIGVTKSNCTTVIVGGSPRSTSCYVIAVMLHAGETAKPRGDRQVQYYRGEDVRSGVIAPLSD
jgi:hypothetical protein